MEILNLIKTVLIIAAIGIIAFMIYQAFQGWKNNPVYKDFATVLGDATAAYSWSKSHWYLFIVPIGLGLFVVARKRWAADKLAEGSKKAKSKGTLEAVKNTVLYNVATQDLEKKNITPEERLKAEEMKAEAVEKFDKASEEEKAEADKIAEESGMEAVHGVKMVAPTQSATNANATNATNSLAGLLNSPAPYFESTCG